MSRTFKRAVFGVSILLVALVFLGGLGPSRVRADSQQDGAYPEMEVYSEVLKKVQTDYVVRSQHDQSHRRRLARAARVARS